MEYMLQLRQPMTMQDREAAGTVAKAEQIRLNYSNVLQNRNTNMINV
jgi:hypothetical protein